MGMGTDEKGWMREEYRFLVNSLFSLICRHYLPETQHVI